MKEKLRLEEQEAQDQSTPVRRCHRGHGELTSEGTCPICRKRSWMYSPLLHLGYGWIMAAICYWVAHYGFLLSGRYDFIVPLFLSISLFIWGIVASIVQYHLEESIGQNVGETNSGPYKRRLPCQVCGDELDVKNWCKACSRQRSRSLTIFVMLLIPMLGMNACFSFFAFSSGSLTVLILTIAVLLPPAILTAIQYFDSQPKMK
jgi:hypothetical protein